MSLYVIKGKLELDHSPVLFPWESDVYPTTQKRRIMCTQPSDPVFGVLLVLLIRPACFIKEETLLMYRHT